MATYILNTPRLTNYGNWTFEGPIAVEEARKRLDARPFISGVGHEDTARFLSQLLDRDVPFNRANIQMEPGDAALVLRLLRRLEEGELLDADGIRNTPHELAWLSYRDPMS